MSGLIRGDRAEVGCALIKLAELAGARATGTQRSPPVVTENVETMVVGPGTGWAVSVPPGTWASAMAWPIARTNRLAIKRTQLERIIMDGSSRESRGCASPPGASPSV